MGGGTQARSPKFVKLAVERRPLSPVCDNASKGSDRKGTAVPEAGSAVAACPSPLKRTQSFPPMMAPSTTSSLNVRKRRLDEAAVSPATANGVPILVHSLPNVKIHVQKKLRLMPKPVGQVQPRPEGVRSVLVYHF